MRRYSIPVQVGPVTIGGNAPVSIQSMTNTDTRDIEATLKQINRLAEAGCELVRLAVPDEASARSLGAIKKRSPLPIIADIHFDYRLALMAIDEGVDKVRINPGNIGGREKLSKVVDRAAKRGIPLRIGVNAGSLSKELKKKHGSSSPEALVESALNTIEFLEKKGFYNLVVSLKATSVPTTVQAYQIIAGQIKYPLHLGITEAGRGLKAAVKSAMGIGSLLLQGIGDTIRVSITGDPVEEIFVAREIIQVAGLRQYGPDIISCPTCARCKINLHELLDMVEGLVKNLNYPLKIAVMGCPVNGPGEAREADVGISGSNDFGIIFKGGKVVRKVALDKLKSALEEEINLIVNEMKEKTENK